VLAGGDHTELPLYRNITISSQIVTRQPKSLCEPAAERHRSATLRGVATAGTAGIRAKPFLDKPLCLPDDHRIGTWISWLVGRRSI
jgi:hypothetical protein